MSASVHRSSGERTYSPDDFESRCDFSAFVLSGDEASETDGDLRTREVTDVQEQWKTFRKSLSFFCKALSISFSKHICPRVQKINNISIVVPPPGKPLTYACSEVALEIVLHLQQLPWLALKGKLDELEVEAESFSLLILRNVEVLSYMGVKLATTPETVIEAVVQRQDLSSQLHETMTYTQCKRFEQYVSFFMLGIIEPGLLNLPSAEELKECVPNTDTCDALFLFIVEQLLDVPTDGGKIALALDFGERITNKEIKCKAFRKIHSAQCTKRKTSSCHRIFNANA